MVEDNSNYEKILDGLQEIWGYDGNSFAIFTEKTSGKFVQFEHGVLDLPSVNLTREERRRAESLFLEGSNLPLDVDTRSFELSQTHDTFQVFITDMYKAAELALAVFEHVFNFPSNFQLETEVRIEEMSNQQAYQQTLDLTERIERSEESEELLGVHLTALYAQTDENGFLTVNGELRYSDTSKLSGGINIMIAIYDNRGRVVRLDRESFYSDSFCGFDIFSAAIPLSTSLEGIVIKVFPRLM